MAAQEPSETVRLGLTEAEALCERAAITAGATPEAAISLARAIVAAEAAGQPNVGIAHLVDHLSAIRAGRIDGRAVPRISRPAMALFSSDAGGGIAQLGFDIAFEEFARVARLVGIAAFAQRNAYTCGSLGYFAARLAETGLVAIAATNGPALMAGAGSSKPVYCTNPLAFAAPVAGGPPLLIDQASSATAFVNLRRAARDGQRIPKGWAVDAEGRPTTDAREAVKGALLAFGGTRGANIALMIEVLAAGLAGANWSLDAPSFVSGSQSPGSGLFIVAVAPTLFAPDFPLRLARQLDRLQRHGVHIPGRTKAAAAERAARAGIEVPRDLHASLSRIAELRYGALGNAKAPPGGGA